MDMDASTLLNIATQIDNSSGYSYCLPWSNYPITPARQPVYTSNLNECCDDRYKKWVESNAIKKEVKKENENMRNDMFNGIFGRIQPGMCRISMSGKTAIKTAHGYKSYDYKTGKLTNCDNFAFDIGEDFFFVIPTNKVKPGDIILASGTPRCVLEVGKNEIKTFCYEDSSITTIVPEHHMFMGKYYFYGKIVSMFGEIGKGDDNSGIKQMMKFMMFKEMMGGKNGIDGGIGSMMPMMMLMGGFGSDNAFFDGMLDLDGDEEAEETEEE